MWDRINLPGFLNLPCLPRRFIGDERGAFAAIFGVSLFAVMLSAGVAVDYSRLHRADGILANALDTAVLAAGSELSAGEKSHKKLRNLFEAHLNANLAAHPELSRELIVEDFIADPKTGRVNATLSTDVKMAFFAIAGRETVPVRSFSEAVFSTDTIEVSMMLDVTGSMGKKGKLGALKRAASDAIDILLPKAGKNGRTRIALVPYAAGVNGGDYAKEASRTPRRCATERKDPAFAATDVSYRVRPLTADPAADCPRHSQVQPLTTNAKRLKREIGKFSAEGYTAGHLGIAWSYYVLSDKWKRLWPRKSRPAAYGDKVQKIALLMTDGEFNTFYRGVKDHHQGGQAKRSNAEALALCADMKRDRSGKPGIIVYAVAFDAPKAAKDTLRKCASPDGGGITHYFEASNEAELRAAFRSIATNITKLRLSR